MLYSVIVIQTPQGDMLEYLYPAANGFVMVIYTDPGKRDEMVGHVNVSLRSVVTEGLTADVWEYEAPSIEDFADGLRAAFGPLWARDLGPDWANQIAFIGDGDPAFAPILRGIREHGVSLTMRIA